MPIANRRPPLAALALGLARRGAASAEAAAGDPVDHGGADALCALAELYFNFFWKLAYIS